ncbi:hypothetical protein AJ78_05950 [Emergomyces pasteurianus Ep9510]|uniref:Major facilitator superfamily (MFS) profile domain-containing protein n=1 Tax=Emergomyces pasteurianus Ep9510 TaxID=1447872 RepID=A0A1J9PC31_9EURO|nr:hypothetical protein AJ78_05950 [Emergomyces pasteurianus Ep9510]
MDESTDELIHPEDFPLPNRSQESLCSQELTSWNITPPLPAVLDQAHHLTASAAPPKSNETQQLVENGWKSVVLFFALAITTFVSALDATSLSVALPVIAREFNASTYQSFWVGISFLLTALVSKPIHSALSAIFRREEILYMCLLYFAVGSIVAGFSKNVDILIAGRALQGFGGGSLEALSEAVVGNITTPTDRYLYMNILSFIWAWSSALGPLIGATFAEHLDWRWIFWINVPLLVIPIVLLPAFRILKPFKLPLRSQISQIDWLGIALFIPSLTLLILAMTFNGNQYQWGSIANVAPLGLGILFLVAFIIREGYALAPIFPYWLFASKTVFASLFGALIHGVAFYTIIFFIPIYFEGAGQLKPVAAAINMLPLSILISVVALITTFVIRHYHRYACFIWVGWFLITLGMGILILLDNKAIMARRLGLQVIGAIGLGILLPALGIPSQAREDGGKTDTTMGDFIFSRQLGAVVGVALGSRIFSNAFSAEVAKLLPLSDRLSSLSDASAAMNFIPLLENLDILADEILGVYERATRAVWISTTLISGLGLISSMFIHELRMLGKDTGKQALQV